MMKPGRLLASAAFAGLLALLAAPANAVVTCDDAGISANSSGDPGIFRNLDCQIGIGGPPVNEALMNTETFFGFGDWVALGKVEGNPFPDGGTFGTFDLQFTGDALSGNWSLDGDVWDNFLNVMIILKDGAPALPGFWVGYLLVRADTGGSYASPFCKIAITDGSFCPLTEIKDISFGELYGSVIPLPAALPMFLLALGSLGFVGRRRRAAAA